MTQMTGTRTAQVVTLVLLCLASACSGESPAAGPEVAVSAGPADGRDPGEPWQRVRDRLDALEASPDSAAAQGALLDTLHRVFASPALDLDLTPAENAVFGAALSRAHALALRGRGDFLEVLMYVSLGPYGATVEGGEWLNELLWENLERHPWTTVAVLAENGEVRQELIESVYARPVHDGFDFAAIRAALESREYPEAWAHAEPDVRRIVESLELSVPSRP